MEKLIRALRCSANVKEKDFTCPEDCPYRVIKEIKQDLPVPEDIVIDGVGYWVCCSFERIALDAAEALEKQIPKKPIMVKDVAETYYICPECEWEVDRFDDNYCSDCGQKLDWAKEE